MIKELAGRFTASGHKQGLYSRKGGGFVLVEGANVSRAFGLYYTEFSETGERERQTLVTRGSVLRAKVRTPLEEGWDVWKNIPRGVSNA